MEMKQVKIYQLPTKHYALFRDYEFMVENGVQLAEYNIVWEGEVEDDAELDDIYTKFNLFRPSNFGGRSLSVSDIVEMDGTYYFCDDFGWKEVYKD